jgi:hypothetical protein
MHACSAIVEVFANGGEKVITLVNGNATDDGIVVSTSVDDRAGIPATSATSAMDAGTGIVMSTTFDISAWRMRLPL